MHSFFIQANGDSVKSKQKYWGIEKHWSGSQAIMDDTRHVGISIPIYHTHIKLYYLDTYLSYHLPRYTDRKSITAEEKGRLDLITAIPARRTFLLTIPDTFDLTTAQRIAEWVTQHFGGYVASAFPITHQAYFTSKLHKRFEKTPPIKFSRPYIEKHLLR